MAKLLAIWIKRAKRGPMDPVERAEAVAGRGLVGSADQGGRRQVTLVDAARWRDVEGDLGARVAPRARRANLFTEGIDYRDSRGRLLRVGGLRVRIHGETRPCERMDEAHAGLRRALEPEWRGGAYGELLDDGELRVGDDIAWIEAEVAG
ncbi:MAG: MOSC domain-containing protein [Betaproteobacteria bacterium]|nr:MOSC domain-containing protein [Betaproteobacteria bacterium]